MAIQPRKNFSQRKKSLPPKNNDDNDDDDSVDTSISDESDITVAIATITNPPFTISVKDTLDRYFIERAITTAVPTSANDNKVNLIILPIETSGILLIIHPAIATVVVQPINIKPAFSTSLGFKFFSLSTISFNVNEKTTNSKEIPTDVKN